MTRTQRKKNANDAIRDQLQRELGAVIREEFPVGTKVVWEIILGYPQYGTVERVPEYDWDHDVLVRNTKTRTTRKIAATELKLDRGGERVQPRKR